MKIELISGVCRVNKHGLTDLYFALAVMATKAFAMSGGLYTYQVALGHSFAAHHPGATCLTTLTKVKPCHVVRADGASCSCLCLRACSFWNRDIPIAELYE